MMFFFLLELLMPNKSLRGYIIFFLQMKTSTKSIIALAAIVALSILVSQQT